MNKHKQFIKDCYNGKYGTMCNEWKQTILNHYPEFEEKLKVGKWYKRLEYKNSLIYCEKITEEGFTGYGINGSNEWEYNYIAANYLSEVKEATEEEVKTALIKEAKKRYKKGDICINTCTLETFKTSGTFEILSTSEIIIVVDKESMDELFSPKGVWGEVVQQTITKEEAEKQLCKKII